jgi:hypothetical protein
VAPGKKALDACGNASEEKLLQSSARGAAISPPCGHSVSFNTVDPHVPRLLLDDGGLMEVSGSSPKKGATRRCRSKDRQVRTKLG